MMGTSALEQTLRHDRLIVAIGIATVVAFSWGYLLAGAGIDMSMADMPMDPEPWSPAQAWLMFAMWWVMMIAMMVPSAAPTILLFATIKRRQATTESPVVASWLFLAGYLVIWAGFSVVAVSLQWGLGKPWPCAWLSRIADHLGARDRFEVTPSRSCFGGGARLRGAGASCDALTCVSTPMARPLLGLHASQRAGRDNVCRCPRVDGRNSLDRDRAYFNL